MRLQKAKLTYNGKKPAKDNAFISLFLAGGWSQWQKRRT